MTEQAPSEVLSQIQRQIDAKKLNDHRATERRRIKELKGQELYSSILELAKNYGNTQSLMVEAGSGGFRTWGHRLGPATQTVIPAVEVGENEEAVRLQIIQEQPQHVDESNYGPKAFNIFINGSILSHIATGGKVTNWYGEEATTEQIDLIKDKIVPAIGLKLAQDFPERNVTRETVSIVEVLRRVNSEEKTAEILYPPDEKGPRTGGRVPRRRFMSRLAE